MAGRTTFGCSSALRERGRVRDAGKRSARFLLFIALLTTLLSLPATSAFAQTENGNVNVTLVTPAGIPASVSLSAKTQYVATKAAAGTRTTVPLSVAPGAYKVRAEPMTIDGQFYVPTSSRPEVPVRTGQTAVLEVTYALDTSARDFHVDGVDQTSIALTWTAQPHYRIVVRRTNTYEPAKAPDQGVDVPVDGNSASDSGLSPGTQYTYALFAQDRGKWVGPMVLRVGTASPDKTTASYVANSQTQILTNSDIVAATTTGAGVRVTLTPGLPTPLIGAAVVLPISSSLPGGFLGVVTEVSSDGQTLTLVAGGIGDAFDYYQIAVPNFEGGDPISVDDALAPAAKSAGSVPGEPRQPLPETPAATPSDGATAGAEEFVQANALFKCSGPSISGTKITFAPALKLAGHFNGTITKYPVKWAPDILTGATLDMAFAATVSAPASVKTSGDASCKADLKPVLIPLPGPVPLSFYFKPTASLGVEGSIEINNLGVAVTAGVELKGHFGLFDGVDFSGGPILKAVPSTPQVVSNASVRFKIGGQIIIGPSAGTPSAGVIAGVGGELNPIDASFGAVFPHGDPRFNACLKASAAFTRELYLVAKAWIPGKTISETVTIDALKGSSKFPGSPWYFPTGCKDAVEPSKDVLGPGVTKVDEQVTGGQNQFGYKAGLIPGKDTWVLSTGNIADVVGVPSKFASTSVGGPGDAALTNMAGRPTYDAVAYTVTVVPTGSTLHVRYAFASEEYPEYVGSAFNDVMAVFVNGKNCATVPGTTAPVSVNTINPGLNSKYYVDNTTGAAGYSTSMDGLTVPLDCSVPVKIGQPVTVKITVADASDAIYDSAVALLDKGIWSE